MALTWAQSPCPSSGSVNNCEHCEEKECEETSRTNCDLEKQEDIANENEEKTFIGEEGTLMKKAKKNGDPYTVTPHIQKVQNV